MKKDDLEFVKREIKSFFLLFYWVIIIAMIIEILNRSSGFENTVIVVLAFIITKILQGGNK
jgi:hypothetical protein